MQNLSWLAVLSWMLKAIGCRRFAKHVLDLSRDVGRGGERSVVRKPDVDRSPVLNIIGKKLATQLLGQKDSYRQEDQRAGQHLPAMFDRLGGDTVVEAGESALASLFHG